MQKVMAHIISKAQSGFIPGRKIVDNIILATELVKAYSRQHISPRCMLKIDLQKAYDSVEWSFLEQANMNKSSIYFGGVPEQVKLNILQQSGFGCGRMQLVQSILFGIQAYWSQLFIIPATVLKLIESYCRSFTWSGSNITNKRALIAWEKVCLSKSVGGMNLINIRLWNQAAIAKTCWDLANKSDKMWIRWIHSFYIKTQQFFTAPIPKQAS
ncbi:hypothetical protein MTR67_017546 [Solanum verrucosum]|uniref:Reverse transcriptase domain-containing protein n=1 Tax=Solanum verrucosum TaxID=315347 RepID=A0AAF0QP18_SOLVR|nr:hypothetical protein MTR67_017546 [Solanum verrucosum]